MYVIIWLNSYAISGVHSEDLLRNLKVNEDIRFDQPWRQSKSCRNHHSPKMESLNKFKLLKGLQISEENSENSGHHHALGG